MKEQRGEKERVEEKEEEEKEEEEVEEEERICWRHTSGWLGIG